MQNAEVLGYLSSEGLMVLFGGEAVEAALQGFENLRNVQRVQQAFQFTDTETKAASITTRAASGLNNAARGVRKSLLLDAEKTNQFVEEIFKINKKFNKGGLWNGTPSSAINTALYYDSIVDQGASIFRSISRGHMFSNGNKRTAVEVFKSFARKNGIKVSLSDKQLLNIAKQVAVGQLDDVTKIGSALTKIKP